MYKKTDCQQEIFRVDAQSSLALQTGLRASWAHLFKVEILPVLLKICHTIRQDWSIEFQCCLFAGFVCFAKLNNLSDQQALDSFGFDIRWRYALDVTDDNAYLSRRSLVEFRRRLTAKDPEMKLLRGVFEKISIAAIEKLGLSESE
ncbi:MAG: transposase [Thermodesulfobacteriota bacterium]|nr:transposase [Thermodesulfobacteriota bacterium]